MSYADEELDRQIGRITVGFAIGAVAGSVMAVWFWWRAGKV